MSGSDSAAGFVDNRAAAQVQQGLQEIMHAKAVVQAKGSQEGEKSLQLKNNSAPNNTFSKTIQRAVGFEYELDSTQVFSKTKEEGTIFNKKNVPLVALKKGDPLVSDFPNFDLIVDSTPYGFDVEVRIKEVDENDAGAMQQLLGTVYQVLAYLEDLQSKSRHGAIEAETIGGPKNVLIAGDFGSGSLQATAGLNLTALYAFLSGEMGKRHTQRMEVLSSMGIEDQSQSVKAYYTRGYGQGSGEILGAAMAVLNRHYPQLKEPDKFEIAAALTSIATIPVTARTHGPLDYAKSAATLLARSDYATILNHFPVPVYQTINTKDKWLALVINTINGYFNAKGQRGVTPDDQIYPVGSIKKANLSLKIGEWVSTFAPAAQGLVGSPKNKDLLTDKNYPKGQYPRDHTDQLESMGGFGHKTDKGKRGDTLPIFEFRKYLKVSNEHLPDVVMGIWELISRANALKKR